MTQHSSEAVSVQFAQLVVQYFVAGRAATIHQLIPVFGDSLHHAVEMGLKAALARTLTFGSDVGNAQQVEARCLSPTQARDLTRLASTRRYYLRGRTARSLREDFHETYCA